MENLRLVLALFLLVGADKINGQYGIQAPELVPLTPRNVTIEPIYEKNIVPAQQNNGRILTPAEGCGYSTTKLPRVVGGGPARNGAFPWMALLGYGDESESYFLCGGSLITSRHVLTAAHCLNSIGPTFVRLGEHDVRHTHDGKHQDVKVVESTPHPKYNRTSLKTDIAMLRLEHDVEFTPRIRPICLPTSDELRSRDFLGANPILAGWGQISEQGDTSPYLKQVQLGIKDCKKAISVDNPEVVCAGGDETGQGCWKGDSGGPLFLSIQHDQSQGKFPYHQIGIVSWSPGCALKHYPSVYTKVQHFADWIHSMIKS